MINPICEYYTYLEDKGIDLILRSNKSFYGFRNWYGRDGVDNEYHNRAFFIRADYGCNMNESFFFSICQATPPGHPLVLRCPITHEYIFVGYAGCVFEEDELIIAVVTPTRFKGWFDDQRIGGRYALCQACDFTLYVEQSNLLTELLENQELFTACSYLVSKRLRTHLREGSLILDETNDQDIELTKVIKYICNKLIYNASRIKGLDNLAHYFRHSWYDSSGVLHPLSCEIMEELYNYLDEVKQR